MNGAKLRMGSTDVQIDNEVLTTCALLTRSMKHTYLKRKLLERSQCGTLQYTVFHTDFSPELFLVTCNTDSKNKLVMEEQLTPPNGI